MKPFSFTESALRRQWKLDTPFRAASARTMHEKAKGRRNLYYLARESEEEIGLPSEP